MFNQTPCQEEQCIPEEPEVKPPTPNYPANTPYQERYEKSFWTVLADMPYWKRAVIKECLVTGENISPSTSDVRLCDEFAAAVVIHAEIE